MRIREQMEITDYVCQATGGFADVKYGAGYDDELGDELKVTLIATGFDKTGKTDQQTTQDELQVEDTVQQSSDTVEPATTEPGEPFIKPQPVDVVAEEPKPEPQPQSGKIVVNLYGDTKEEREPVKPKEEEVGGDALVDNIRLISVSEATTAPVEQVVATEPEAVVTPQPVVEDKKQAEEEVSSLISKALRSELSTLDASERIRKVYEMLHFDPAGPDKAQSMTTQQIAESEALDTVVLPHSSVREASSYTVQSNGEVTSVPTYRDKVD
jgi:cell division protein FtsZ